MLNISRTHNNLVAGFFNLGAPVLLLTVSGVALGIGYLLNLAGFGSWLPLAVAGASLLVAGALSRNQSRFSIPTVVIAIEGAILCTMALPGQFSHSEFIAGVANLAVIATLITAAAVILRQPKSVFEK